jgi:hypothetical protein
MIMSNTKKLKRRKQHNTLSGFEQQRRQKWIKLLIVVHGKIDHG